MQLHELNTINKRQGKKRVGRGGKRGTYSGHGIKGQKSRAGKNFKPIVRDLLKRYPKLKGYKVKRRMDNVAVLNVQALEKAFSVSEIVNPKELLKKGLINKISGKTPKVKILGTGEIKKALNIYNCQASKEAKEKIEKAGGKIHESKKEKIEKPK